MQSARGKPGRLRRTTMTKYQAQILRDAWRLKNVKLIVAFTKALTTLTKPDHSRSTSK